MSFFSKLKTNWFIILLLLFSIIICFTISNLLFPLAGLSKKFKLMIILIVFFLVIGCVWWINLKVFKKLVFSKNNLIISFTLSIVLTFFIFTLIPLRQPYYPITESIKISTESPNLRFSYIMRVFDKNSSEYLKSDYTFSGAWNTVRSGWEWQHKGSETGDILYEGTTLIREDISYEVGFLRNEKPAFADLVINGTTYSVEIPALDGDEESFLYQTPFISMNSYSKVWQIVTLLYPIFNALTIFIVLFWSILYIISKDYSWFEKFLHTVFISLFFYLFWLVLPYQNRFFNMNTRSIIVLLYSVILFVIIPILLNFVLSKFRNSKWILLGIVIVIGIAIRFYWIRMVHSVPVSDFGDFHRWAMQIANNEPGLYIDRYTNFTRILAVFYHFFPSIEAVEIVNLCFSVGTLVCIYFILDIAGFCNLGIIGAYLFAIFPSEFSMITLVNTDIPSVFFLTLSVLFLILFIKKEVWWILIFSGASFALATLIRGALVVYAFVIICALLIIFFKNKEYNLILRNILIVGLTYISIRQGASALINRVEVEDMVIEEGYYMIWPLVNGVNVDQLGRTNDGDNAMVHSWNSEEANKIGIPIVLERIFSNPVGFYGILDEKYEYMFADATYGALWAFVDESLETFNIETGWSVENEISQRIFSEISQYSYVLIVLFAFLASYKFSKKASDEMILSSVVVLSSFLAYTFFEVQPRYQRPIIPFIIIIASLLFQKMETYKVDKIR